MLGLDTETTGLDLYHDATPFLVTFCDKESNNTFFEWYVNPITREVLVDSSDIKEIVYLIKEAEYIVFQNGKFDVTALLKILPEGFEWPWHKTRDTLIAGHLLKSNGRHDLTSLVMEYLSVDVAKYEKAMEKSVQKCRRLVQQLDSPIKDWFIAATGTDGMPSAKARVWKYDLWLPRAVVRHAKTFPQLEIETEPEWETETSEYANIDSATTIALYLEMVKHLKRRGLWKLYLERLNILRVVQITESNGITLNENRLRKLQTQYEEESDKAGHICTNIAKTYGYELVLPKSGNNNSLRTFLLDVLELPILARSKKTGAAKLDKDVLEEYEHTLPLRSRQLKCVKSLRGKRKRDTALNYMQSYDKFWVPTVNDHWFRLHPSLNPTGTDTLRWSSSNPNEQNISKKEGFNLRYMFGPAPGREWWSLDFNNIELRIPAYVAKEQEMIDLFERSDEPPYYGSVHLLNFHTIYEDHWKKGIRASDKDQVGKWCKKEYASSWYQYCKNGNFAVQYGSVEQSGTADRAYHRKGSFNKIKKRFKKIHGPGGLNAQMIEHAKEFGYVNTLPDITVDAERGYPLNCTLTRWGDVMPTIPLNYFTQGTACWVMTRAMVKTQRYLDSLNETYPGSQCMLIMQIHDEIVLDFPFVGDLGNLPKIRTVQKLVSSIGNDLVPKVPLPVGIDYHATSWSESQTID